MKASIVILLLAAEFVYSSPIGGSCVRYNPYTWEVYRIMYTRPKDQSDCENEFINSKQNVNYCSSNSVMTLNIVQDTNERLPVAMTTSSGSGATQPTIVNDQKCMFNVNFTFDRGTILGGEIRIYNHKTTNDKYQVKLFNKTAKDELVLIQSSHLSTKQEKRWSGIELNEFMAGYGKGSYQLYFYAQFIRNNEEISCKEAQTIFTTNCMEPTNAEPPAMVIIAQREPTIFRRTRSTNNGPSEYENCNLQQPGDSDGLAMCMDEEGNVCEVKDTKNITRTTIQESTATVQTILSCQ